ncbi:oxygenase MpaB family protein [Antrihabitans stalagmiti]|nr:oxygenase MpaB family protein [Antrihabitans stalagmiti]
MTRAVAEIKPSAHPSRRPIEPGTRMWDETGLVSFSLTAGTAFLLQTMEPTISTVVDEHSTFRTDPLGRAARSIASVMMWVYGGDEAIAEADRLREMHKHLNSVDAHGVRHTALSTKPWAWVLHTGTYAFCEGAKYFAKQPLTYAEKEAYYQETVQLMRNFKVAEKEIPATYADFVVYFDDVVAHDLKATAVTKDFLRLSAQLPAPPQLPRAFRPLWTALTAPVGKMQYLATVGTTPEVARRKLGIEWTATDERKLRALGWAVARGVPLLPERLRYFPIAYEARRLERGKQRLRKMIDLRPM